ncbi:MAG: tyrosine-type recombinase/integrase [Limnohabitans sp.]
MARIVDKLNPLMVAKATKPGYYSDGNGLYLQVSVSSSKSWIFRFTIKGKQREMGLGAVHTISLAEARLKAKEQRLMLVNGLDPITVREQAREAEVLARAKMMTFDECAAQYIAAHRNSWKNAKHAGQWETTLATYASPVFGSLPVAEIDLGLVMKVLNPLWAEKTETAKRLRGRIESVLGWATTSGYRQGENPARWRGHLENLLAAPNKIKPVKHQPSLPWKEVGQFMTALRQQDGIASRALEFLILTATRTSETLEARWEEIDLKAGVWVIPAIRMKAGIEHHVPLSTEAMALISKMPRVDKYVFTGSTYGKPLSDMSLTAVLKRMHEANIKSGGKGWIDPKEDNRRITSHGFRSTFRMWGAESVSHSFPREVIEFALAHKLPDAVESSYQRGTVFDKRIPLMQTWADYCGKARDEATVTPIRRSV